MTDQHESERIRLAKWMQEGEGNRLVVTSSRLLMWLVDPNGNTIGGTTQPFPNPFVDANHDFAILKRMRKLGKKHGVWNYQNADSVKWMRAISDSCKFARDYQIGDYARAALKALERA